MWSRVAGSERVIGAETAHHLHKQSSRVNHTLLLDNAETNHGLRFTKFFGRWKANEFNAPALLKEVKITYTEVNDRPHPGQPDKRNKSDKVNTHGILDWLNPDALQLANVERHRIEAHAEVLESVGDPVLLKEAHGRLDCLCRALEGRCFSLQAVSRAMTGLGLPHPTENGFAFDYLLGVPVLEGSALKAIALRWATEAAVDRNDITRVLGSAEKGVGSVGFLQGLPERPVRLTAEQITQHNTGYYGGPNPVDGTVRTDKEIPANWYEPTPITLLAMDASLERPQPFIFHIVPLTPKAKDDCELAQAWLTSGLEEFGFGARSKTFGHFKQLPNTVKVS